MILARGFLAVIICCKIAGLKVFANLNPTTSSGIDPSADCGSQLNDFLDANPSLREASQSLEDDIMFDLLAYCDFGLLGASCSADGANFASASLFKNACQEAGGYMYLYDENVSCETTFGSFDIIMSNKHVCFPVSDACDMQGMAEYTNMAGGEFSNELAWCNNSVRASTAVSTATCIATVLVLVALTCLEVSLASLSDM